MTSDYRMNLLKMVIDMVVQSRSAMSSAEDVIGQVEAAFQRLMALTSDEGMVSIPKNKFKELSMAYQKLNALYGAGVDNWEGYDEAAAQFPKEGE
jgi:hypothetical protein